MLLTAEVPTAQENQAAISQRPVSEAIQHSLLRSSPIVISKTLTERLYYKINLAEKNAITNIRLVHYHPSKLCAQNGNNCFWIRNQQPIFHFNNQLRRGHRKRRGVAMGSLPRSWWYS